jgi:hypothetical protein
VQVVGIERFYLNKSFVETIFHLGFVESMEIEIIFFLLVGKLLLLLHKTGLFFLMFYHYFLKVFPTLL